MVGEMNRKNKGWWGNCSVNVCGVHVCWVFT
jgi:hypothetical protein